MDEGGEEDGGLELSLGLSCGGSGRVLSTCRSMNSIALQDSGIAAPFKRSLAPEETPPPESSGANLTRHGSLINLKILGSPLGPTPAVNLELGSSSQTPFASVTPVNFMDALKSSRPASADVVDVNKMERLQSSAKPEIQRRFQEARMKRKHLIEEQKQQKKGKKEDDRSTPHGFRRPGSNTWVKGLETPTNAFENERLFMTAEEPPGERDRFEDASHLGGNKSMGDRSVDATESEESVRTESEASERKEEHSYGRSNNGDGEASTSGLNVTAVMSSVASASNASLCTIPPYSVMPMPTSMAMPYSMPVPMGFYASPYFMQFTPPVDVQEPSTPRPLGNNFQLSTGQGFTHFPVSSLSPPPSWVPAVVRPSISPPFCNSVPDKAREDNSNNGNYNDNNNNNNGNNNRSQSKLAIALETPKSAKDQEPVAFPGFAPPPIPQHVLNLSEDQGRKGNMNLVLQAQCLNAVDNGPVQEDIGRVVGGPFHKGSTENVLSDGCFQDLVHLIRPGIAGGVKFGGTGSSPDLPWVSTSGPGPTGKTICGVVYKINRNQLRIVCACHGQHMSTSEFVQHAGSIDTSNSEQNGVVNRFPHTSQPTSALG